MVSDSEERGEYIILFIMTRKMKAQRLERVRSNCCLSLPKVDGMSDFPRIAREHQVDILHRRQTRRDIFKHGLEVRVHVSGWLHKALPKMSVSSMDEIF